MDVFDDAMSGDGRREPVAGTDAVSPAQLDPVLDGAALWGLELDARYRVLAATFEPTTERYVWGEVDDRRIQVLLSPVSTILVSLRAVVGGSPTVQMFDVEQLVDVVAAFGGGTVAAPVFGGTEPRPGEWGPQFSLQGRSSAPDGTRSTLRLGLRADDLALDVFARFDDVHVRGADGGGLAPPV